MSDRSRFWHFLRAVFEWGWRHSWVTTEEIRALEAIVPYTDLELGSDAYQSSIATGQDSPSVMTRLVRTELTPPAQ